MDTVSTAWRKCVRMIFGLHYRTHCTLLPHVSKTDSFEVQLHRQYVRFINKSVNSSNPLLRVCCRRAVYHGPSITNSNVSDICHRYRLCRDSLIINARPPMLNAEYDEEDKRIGTLVRQLVEQRLASRGQEYADLSRRIDDLCLNWTEKARRWKKHRCVSWCDEAQWDSCRY